MANTYTQIYLHIIFAVKSRHNLILPSYQEELHKYISGIITKLDQKLISINGAEDHLHILIGIKPNVTVSELVRDIKANSSRFIRQKKFVKSIFEWQEGFGAFSVCQSQLQAVIRYIENQQKQHASKTFTEEYIQFLHLYKIEFDKRFIFKSFS